MSSSSGLTHINKNKWKRKPCFNRKYLKKKKEKRNVWIENYIDSCIVNSKELR